MKFKIISCVNQNLFIGKNGDLLYHIQSDLKNFRSMTMGGVIIMGRKTFESLPNSKPLDGRINVIITSNEYYSIDSQYDNVYIVHSIEDAIALCEALFYDRDCFVIGGETIYKSFLDSNMVDTLYITNVNDDAEGDAKFPNVFDNWRIFYQSYTQRQRSDEITYKFIIYKK